MTTHGPAPGVRSKVMALRDRAARLELPDYPGVHARPETVARLVAAQVRLKLGDVDVVEIDLGQGVKGYAAGDVDTLLALCSEAFAAHDAVAL